MKNKKAVYGILMFASLIGMGFAFYYLTKKKGIVMQAESPEEESDEGVIQDESVNDIVPAPVNIISIPKPIKPLYSVPSYEKPIEEVIPLYEISLPEEKIEEVIPHYSVSKEDQMLTDDMLRFLKAPV